MVYKVRMSESSGRDLDEILLYMAEKLANPKAATDFADALEEKYTVLETHPLMFELSQNKRLAQRGYRRFIVGNYVALYLVDEKRQRVNIARIFYGSRDYEKNI